MTAPDDRARPVPPARMTADQASATLLERLADELGSLTSGRVVYGEPVTNGGVTVIPVAEVSVGFGLGFGGGAGSEGDAGKTGGEGAGGGGVRARPRGFIEIKNGTVTYKPFRNPWLDAAVPLAALLAGTALPGLTRRLAKRCRG
ncbi:spore germination protein GerW family protein [Streptomyces yatensis]|uniref:Sporulation protein n=1 Tax=Streptomyces yatensis TaxID=155177 RepID=A0ABN2IWC5_9ACTN|nr:spore germination protein GerW family protein [Streptomyces yatensis]